MAPGIVSGSGDKPEIDRAAMRRRMEQVAANPPMMLCGYCGWRGQATALMLTGWPMVVTQDGQTGEWSESSLSLGGTFTCPRCREERAEPQGGPWLGFGVALRDADLTADEIRDFAEYLNRSGPDLSADQVAADYPALASLVRAMAKWSPERWLALLSLLMSILSFAGDQLRDSPAPRIVVQPARPIVIERTGVLTDAQMDELLNVLQTAIEKVDPENPKPRNREDAAAERRRGKSDTDGDASEKGGQG